MADLKKADLLILINCDNGECGRYSFKEDLEKNDYKCPYCGKLISKKGPTKAVTGETTRLSLVAKSKEKLRELIDFLIFQKRRIIVKIDGNRTPYTSRIIKAVYGDILSKDGKRDKLIIEMLTPDTGNTFLKFSQSVVIQFLLRNKLFQFESRYLGESTEDPHIGLIVSFPESVGIK